MRDRLIELLKNSPHLDVLFGGDEEYAKAADHLLAAGCIVPPCKVGQNVYYETFGYDDNKKWRSFGVQPHEVLDIYVVVNTKGANLYASDFGDGFFLTREEAEKALAERSKR
jgi:hypothetical protein